MHTNALIEREIQRVREYLARPGTHLRLPDSEVPGYVERVLNQHQALVERWDGWEHRYSWEPGEIPDEILRKCWSGRGRNAVIPNFTHPMYQSRHWLYEDTEIPFGLDPSTGAPTTCKIRNGQSVAKAVLAAEFAGERFFWDRFFTQLGWWWSLNTIDFVFSCAPSAFLGLGDYGDGGSCFALGAENEVHKSNLSTIPGSCVALLHANNGPKVFGRMWGFILPEVGAIFTNNYLFDWREIPEAIRAAAQSASGCETLKYRRANAANPLLELERRDIACVNDEGTGAVYLAAPEKATELVVRTSQMIAGSKVGQLAPLDEFYDILCLT